MSVEKNTYGIIGYNLTDIKDILLTEKIFESEKYEDLTCYQRVGNIQAFTDPMNGNYFYFGYIFFESDDSYEDVMRSITLSEARNKKKEIEQTFKKYFNYIPDIEPKIIVFNEYR
ncbi:protein of unknown function [Ruminococcaceae bacterium BL-6]|nr:protein of unknown function [Ruminococcaceae bacterium BL-6]